MTATFRIVKLDRQSIAGDDLFTVIATVDGEVKGGDHHWVARRFAERAMRLYEVDPAAHGLTPGDLRKRYLDHFSEAMFAPPAEGGVMDDRPVRCIHCRGVLHARPRGDSDPSTVWVHADESEVCPPTYAAPDFTSRREM